MSFANGTEPMLPGSIDLHIALRNGDLAAIKYGIAEIVGF